MGGTIITTRFGTTFVNSSIPEDQNPIIQRCIVSWMVGCTGREGHSEICSERQPFNTNAVLIRLTFAEYKNNATVRCLDWVYDRARSMAPGLPDNMLGDVHALEDWLLCVFDKSRSDRLNFKPSGEPWLPLTVQCRLSLSVRFWQQPDEYP